MGNKVSGFHQSSVLFCTGPFKNSDMAEWFNAGYFTMNLLVRAGMDGDFTTLGQ
jgi:GYF domain